MGEDHVTKDQELARMSSSQPTSTEHRFDSGKTRHRRVVDFSEEEVFLRWDGAPRHVKFTRVQCEQNGGTGGTGQCKGDG